MPSRPMRPCKQPGCRALVASGYCDAHAYKASNWAKRVERKGSTTARGYGAAWQRLRASILKRDHYLCQVCIRKGRVTEASQVDHIKAKAAGGTDDEGNLQSICEPCHKAKTARERLA
ncbi:HNH endonuclease (plasmid) [Paraburkholderia strydomiana]